ncbi:MAG: hypothetical protein GWO38_17915 [Phycisphaerae bacterium]|nr:hypothetical protein [Phycisphaerae bacterium]NIX29453.1 hypothetical protein [Phycisphaerae bacterium]
MDELSRRIRRVTESILENESLTADLNDEAAEALLDWMIDCAKMVAQSTATLDEQAAEEAMSSRLRAIRRLMRLVNNWISQGPPAELVANQDQLDKILEQATIIYGQDFTTFDSNRLNTFWEQEVDSVKEPQQLIESLRVLIEDLNDQIIPDTGEANGR